MYSLVHISIDKAYLVKGLHPKLAGPPEVAMRGGALPYFVIEKLSGYTLSTVAQPTLSAP